MAAADRPTSLYRFYDSERRLLYIGITSVGVARWQQHSGGSRWWPEVASAEVEHFGSRVDAAEAETRAIAVERPLHNVSRPGVPAAERPARTAPARSDVTIHAARDCTPLDLRTAEQVAGMLGLARPQGVHEYRRRYKDFPLPVYDGDKTVLWVRQDIDAWRAKHPPRLGANRERAAS